VVYASNTTGSKELIRAISSQAEGMNHSKYKQASYKQVEVSITDYFVGFLIEVGWFVLLVTSFKSRVLGIIFLFYSYLNLTEGVENLFFACASIWQRE